MGERDDEDQGDEELPFMPMKADWDDPDEKAVSGPRAVFEAFFGRDDTGSDDDYAEDDATGDDYAEDDAYPDDE